ncbi:MAG: GH92 family glycosyl hydrolase [Prevotella sp.]|nr:GH92 family glycosyl hydrolase [Prevotella sp.]
MIKIKTIFALVVMLWTTFCWGASDGKLTSYVDPSIGTGGHGHVFMGANVPFGFVQVGPTEHTRGWDWCSGYHASDSVLLGFAHTHLSGTGCGDLGDVRFLPVSDRNVREVVFSHADEVCRPGYYSLQMKQKDADIFAEMTASKRAAIHRYTFKNSGDTARVLIDLKWGTGWDRVTRCRLMQTDGQSMEGWRHSNGWANNQRLYFAISFSHPVKMEKLNGDSLVMVSCELKDGEPLLVKVGFSAVNVRNARTNLNVEIPDWDFNNVYKQADEAWEQQLSKVKVTTADDVQKRVFYTCLFHTMVAPSVFCDVNGDYRGSDDEIYNDEGQWNLTTFSLWDTYRAWHPLATIIHPEMQSSLAKTMLHIYQQQGTLPVWHLMGCETNCMVGCPATIVLADMMLKGFNVGDRELAIEAMRQSVGSHKRAHGLLVKHGYIPFDLDNENESVGKGLEYAIAYGCASKVSDDPMFERLGQSYKNYFDKQTHFMRAVSSDGAFRNDFDPFAAEMNHIKDYTEGNAWQYIWLVPHDVKGLIELFGSEKAFVEKLDSLFIVQGDLGEDAPPDITGLIGQYAHGNEPSHHIPYLYNYVGQQWKTALHVREIMETMYHDGIDGLCGNEDVGQMSAWYVLSALGFYQVDPAGGRYLFGSPLFDEASIQVGEGKTFTVKTLNNSKKNVYIQSIRLNGRKYTQSFIDFSDIAKGGVLEITMGPKPSKFGTKKGDRP